MESRIWLAIWNQFGKSSGEFYLQLIELFIFLIFLFLFFLVFLQVDKQSEFPLRTKIIIKYLKVKVSREMNGLSYFPTTIPASFCCYHTELWPKSSAAQNRSVWISNKGVFTSCITCPEAAACLYNHSSCRMGGILFLGLKTPQTPNKGLSSSWALQLLLPGVPHIWISSTAAVLGAHGPRAHHTGYNRCVRLTGPWDSMLPRMLSSIQREISWH